MSALSVPELLSIRQNQVLRKALALCQVPPSRRPARGVAFEIVTQNLVLHGYPGIAAKLTEAGGARVADLDAIAAELRDLEERTRQIWPAHEGDAEVVGLSGFPVPRIFSRRFCLSMRVSACPAPPSTLRLCVTTRLSERLWIGFPSFITTNVSWARYRSNSDKAVRRHSIPFPYS